LLEGLARYQGLCPVETCGDDELVVEVVYVSVPQLERAAGMLDVRAGYLFYFFASFWAFLGCYAGVFHQYIAHLYDAVLAKLQDE
jgi:hypothetical protein